MDENLQTRWRNRYGIALTGAGCSLLLDPTGKNVAESCYVAGALDVLGLLAQRMQADTDLLDLAATLYDEADKRLRALDDTRASPMVRGPYE